MWGLKLEGGGLEVSGMSWGAPCGEPGPTCSGLPPLAGGDGASL